MDDVVLEKFLAHLESRWSTPKYKNLLSIQQTCDESIKDVQEVLRRVAEVCNTAISRYNAYRNAASSIHCLPVEILQVIFEFSGQCGLDRRTNLALASVCTYWRSVALNDPCMWSCLDEATTPLNYAQLCTHRNRCMPLHVTRVWPEWCKGYSSPRWLLDFTASNLARLKALHFKVGTDDDAEPPIVTRYPAPMLEELVLHVEHQSEIYSSVLADLAPRLRTLELYNCRWPWRPKTYRNLTRLKVTLPYAVDPSPLGEDITVICRESSGLEELCLCIGGEKVSGPPSTPVVPQYGDERTVMRSLRKLTLALRIDLAVSLLSSIHLTSTTTHIDIVALIENDAPDILDTLFSAQCLPSWLYAGLDQLSLKTLDRRCEIRGAGLNEGIPYDLSVAWKGRSLIGRTWGPVVAAIVRDHVLPAVSQLTLTEDSNTRHNHEDLPLVGQQPLLLRLPTVSSLSINYWSPRGAAGFFKKLHSFLSTQPSRPLPAVSQFALAIRDCWGQYSYDLLSVLQDFDRLSSVHIKDSRLTIGSIDNARDFVSQVRELDVPDVRWSRSYMYAWGEGNSQRLVYPRDLWPEDAEYDWLCDEEASHAASSVNAFGQTWCCGYGAARR